MDNTTQGGASAVEPGAASAPQLSTPVSVQPDHQGTDVPLTAAAGKKVGIIAARRTGRVRGGANSEVTTAVVPEDGAESKEVVR